MKITNDKNAGQYDGIVSQRTEWAKWRDDTILALDKNLEDGGDTTVTGDDVFDSSREFFRDCYLAGMVPTIAVRRFYDGG